MTERLSGFINAYKYIFSLPSTKNISLRIFVLVLIWYLLYLTNVTKLSLQGITLSILIIYLTLIPAAIGERKIFIPRRLYGISVYFIIWSIMFSLISNSISLSIIPVIFTLSLSSLYMSDNKLLQGFYPLLSLCIGFLLNIFIGIFVVIYLVMLLVIYYRINKRVNEKLGIKGIEMFKAFIRYILAGEREKLENLLELLSVYKRIPVFIYKFADNEMRTIGLLIVSSIHPGLFRDLGSGSLPYRFLSYSSKRGFVGLFTKGVCDHSENLVRSSDVDNVLRCIFNEDEASGWKELSLTNISRSKVNDITCLSLVFHPNHILSIISRRNKGMEDIPLEVLTELSLKNHKVVIIDAHNSEDHKGINPKPVRGSILYNNMIKCILGNAVSYSSISSANKAIKVGFSHKDLSSFKPEICPGGLSFLALEFEEERYFIASIDGNNMVKGLNEWLRGNMLGLGFKDGEIVTTDNHLYSGIVPKVGYTPIGYNTNWKTLLNKLKEAASEALGKLQEARVLFREVSYEGKYVDMEKLTLLSEITHRNVKEGLLLFDGLLLSYVLTFIFALLGF